MFQSEPTGNSTQENLREKVAKRFSGVQSENGIGIKMTENDFDPELDTELNSEVKKNSKIRRIMAWCVLGLFSLLILNLLFFHWLLGETTIVYIGLMVAFFLGNGVNRQRSFPMMDNMPENNEDSESIEDIENQSEAPEEDWQEPV